MQSVLEVTTPVCGPQRTSCGRSPSYAPMSRRSHGLRAAGWAVPAAPVQPLRTPADHGSRPYRQLVDQLQYVARRELIFRMHITSLAVDDPEKAIQVMNGLLLHLPQMLALSASSPFWRGAEPTGLSSSRQMVSPLPALGAAAAFQGLRRLRRGGRPARADGVHRRLHPHLVGYSPAPAPRHDRDACLRRGPQRRLRTGRRDHRLFPGARQAVLRAVRVRPRDPELASHADDREQSGSLPLRPGGAGDGSGDREAEPGASRPVDPSHGSATSSLTRAEPVPSANSRGSRDSLRVARAAVQLASERAATSSRWCGRSRWRPRLRQSLASFQSVAPSGRVTRPSANRLSGIVLHDFALQDDHGPRSAGRRARSAARRARAQRSSRSRFAAPRHTDPERVGRLSCEDVDRDDAAVAGTDRPKRLPSFESTHMTSPSRSRGCRRSIQRAFAVFRSSSSTIGQNGGSMVHPARPRRPRRPAASHPPGTGDYGSCRRHMRSCSSKDAHTLWAVSPLRPRRLDRLARRQVTRRVPGSASPPWNRRHGDERCALARRAAHRARRPARPWPCSASPSPKWCNAIPARRSRSATRRTGRLWTLSSEPPRFGRDRDLPHDLDDVLVRVPDPQLPVGAVAAREDLANAFELALGAQLARMRLDVA